MRLPTFFINYFLSRTGVDMLVHEGEKGGLCLDAALQGLLDILSLEVRFLFHKHIESLLDGKQQLPDVLVGLHGFLALVLLWLL